MKPETYQYLYTCFEKINLLVGPSAKIDGLEFLFVIVSHVGSVWCHTELSEFQSIRPFIDIFISKHTGRI